MIAMVSSQTRILVDCTLHDDATLSPSDVIFTNMIEAEHSQRASSISSRMLHRITAPPQTYAPIARAQIRSMTWRLLLYFYKKACRALQGRLWDTPFRASFAWILPDR